MKEENGNSVPLLILRFIIKLGKYRGNAVKGRSRAVKFTLKAARVTYLERKQKSSILMNVRSISLERCFSAF